MYYNSLMYRADQPRLYHLLFLKLLQVLIFMSNFMATSLIVCVMKDGQQSLMDIEHSVNLQTSQIIFCHRLLSCPAFAAWRDKTWATHAY